MRTSLVAAPFKYDFSWELMAWVPHLRYLSRQHEHVVVGCDKKVKFLYEDFADRFYHRVNRRLALVDLRHGKLDEVEDIPQAIHNRDGHWRYLRPGYTKKVYFHPRLFKEWKQREFIRYGKKTDKYDYDIAFHSRRTIHFYRYRYKNWKRWGELSDYLSKYKLCTIGSYETDHVPGTDDQRNIPLSDLCDLLASTRLMLAPSTGPTFLAHLCGCPVITWAPSYWDRLLNVKFKQKHLRFWRPFDTYVDIIDDCKWDPPALKVKRRVEKFLNA